MDILLSPHLFSQTSRTEPREEGMDALAMVGCGGNLTVVSQHHNHPRNFTPAFLTKQKPFLTGHFKSVVSFQASRFLSSSSQGFRRLNVERRTQSSDTQIFMPHLVASMEGVEQSYIMIKPDGVQRGLVGEIISRFEKKGFVLKGLKLFRCPQELAEEHYKDLKAKSFFPKLIDYITSGPVVCMAWEGVGVVQAARKLIGSTNPLQAEPGTIRGDLAVQTGRNVVHGSDSPENGQREVALWFNEGELCHWTPAQAQWLYE